MFDHNADSRRWNVPIFGVLAIDVTKTEAIIL